MSVLNKIPFGLRESDNELVDVNDVPNGKQCGCICPSCRTLENGVEIFPVLNQKERLNFSTNSRYLNDLKYLMRSMNWK